jgi:hypothetical protein
MNATQANHGWRKGKTARKCNRYPTVWAAIYGCKGEKTTTWRYTVGSFGHRVAEYACPCCQAVSDAHDKMNHAERQEALTQAQELAGVADYRTARAKVINGVPTLL